MKSSEVMASWDATQPVFGRQIRGWLYLHRICAAGEAGASVMSMLKRGRVPSQETLKKWELAGLVVRHEEGVKGRQGHKVRYVATDKARRLLRVEAESNAEGEG